MAEAATFFDQLTLFELIQISYLQREGMFMKMSIYLTLLTGFLVLTYLIAEKLDRAEAIAVSALYSAVSMFLIFDYTQLSMRNLSVTAHVTGNEPNTVVFYLIPMLMASGWLLSIWYIIRKRRSA